MDEGQEQNESNDNKMKALTKIKGKRGRPSKVQDCSKENNHCKCCAKFAEQKIADRKKARAQIDLGDFQCDICPYKVPFAKHTKRIREHKATHDQMFCDQCNYETNSKKDLWYHSLSHKEKPMHLCDKCDYKSRKAGNVEKHKLSVHEGIRLNCDQCDKRFSQHSELDRHKSAAHGVILDPLHKCHLCLFTTKHRQFLTKHLKMHVVDWISINKVWQQCTFPWWEQVKICFGKLLKENHRSKYFVHFIGIFTSAQMVEHDLFILGYLKWW